MKLLDVNRAVKEGKPVATLYVKLGNDFEVRVLLSILFTLNFWRFQTATKVASTALGTRNKVEIRPIAMYTSEQFDDNVKKWVNAHEMEMFPRSFKVRKELQYRRAARNLHR